MTSKPACSTPSSSDAADAFEELRKQVSLLHSAIEGLTAAKEKLPDYSPTLREIRRALEGLDNRLASIEAKPAMRLTPAVMADEFGKRALDVRAEDRQAIGTAREALARALGHVEGMMRKGRSIEEQRWWITWTATGSALIAIFVTLVGIQFAI